MIKDENRILESHGLWELSVVRLAAMVEIDASRAKLAQALKDEREAFANWQRVSRECGA